MQNNEKPIVFLSHSSLDKEPLAALKKILDERAGGFVNFFLSSDGESITFGRNWVVKVSDALANAKLMFVFLSAQSADSKWVHFETGYACAKDIQVVPVCLPGIDFNRITPPISLLHGFNLHSHDAMGNIARICNKTLEGKMQESFTVKDFENLVSKMTGRGASYFGDYAWAILAGGLATRLRPITETIPKSLVPVAGRPFLAHQLEMLHAQGIRRAVLCIGFLGEMIQREFGDEAFGIKLDYSFDGEKLLGTGGAIKRALPKLGGEFFILYGDSYLPIPYAPVAEFFHRSGKLGLMTVYHNQGKYDTSNVVFRGGEIVVYDKKAKLPEMRHIDYGLSLFKSSVFEAYPEDEKFDLAEVMGKLVHEKQLAGYEVPERFYEMGSPAGLAELEALLKTQKMNH